MSTKTILICFAVILLCGLSFGQQSFCNVNYCGKNQHTLCKYQSTKPGGKCQHVIGVGLTNDEKQRILELHNTLRQKVAKGQERRGAPGPQPPASNMANLEWDDEIANIAQRWANQCDFGHDSCRSVARFGVGQNVAYQGTTVNINGIRVEQMVMNWYDEVKDYNKNSVSKFDSPNGAGGRQVGHYTQLVWAKSTKLGCGAIKYNDGRFNKFYLVCNYGSAGNFIGQPVYNKR